MDAATTAAAAQSNVMKPLNAEEKIESLKGHLKGLDKAFQHMYEDKASREDF